MPALEIIAEPSDALRETVAAMARLVSSADGSPALEGLDPLTADGGFVVATRGDDVVGAAVMEPGRGAWAVGIIIPPDHRGSGDDERLAVAATTHARKHGASAVHLWLSESTPVLGEGPGKRRQLLELRVDLPLIDVEASLPVRSFVAGNDEEAVLGVNNRAFHWHPEQGGWTLEQLRARTAEPWFRPEGLLLHEVDGHLAGFCWTKVHADHEPPLGEIHIIGVDPEHQGQGLGRGLTVAGFDWLSRQGLGTGMLWVESDNDAARALYESLGMREHRRRVARVLR